MKIGGAPSPYSLTTVIYIVPRYILINNLEYPLEIAQKLEKGKTPHSVIIAQGERINYIFEEETPHKWIKIRDYSPTDPLEEGRWSSGFIIEDIEDFQVKFEAGGKHPDHHKTREKEEMDPYVFPEWTGAGDIPVPEYHHAVGQRWYQPSLKNNHHHYMRVCINSPDEASIFVMFEHTSTI